MTTRSPRGADLHTHTVFSDGTCTPEDLIARAVRAGLKTLAVTDHDTMDALPRAQAAAAGIELIPGVEFSTPSRDDGAEEAHIVGLFLDAACLPLKKALAAFRQNRRERVVAMVEKLNRLGVALRVDDVFRQAGEGNVGRLHVARALLKAGHIRSIQEAFHKWIRVGRPAYVPRKRPPLGEIVALIHHAGGAAVMAHPGQTGVDGDIPAMVEAGLDGIEVYYPEHSARQRKHYLRLAQEYGLLVSGGSDFHGGNKKNSVLGSVRVEEDCVQALRERAESYRTERGLRSAPKPSGGGGSTRASPIKDVKKETFRLGRNTRTR